MSDYQAGKDIQAIQSRLDILEKRLNQLESSKIGHFYEYPSSLGDLSTEGYYVSRIYLDIKHDLFTFRPTSEIITSYIKKHRPNWDQPFSAEALANRIIEVADALLIDPRIFTGLIRKESTFNMNAVSPTGAVGSTQITLIAVKEFMDQVGMTIKSKLDADRTAVDFFRAAVKKLIPNLDPSI
ncbi:transglycosylase SLT domain-containing protein [Pseudanabaena sp. FACHB-2040]|uniref:transglycosylase SLT domain-containing protein n=1 Tax=Pseudanabaena sp. FACHB-2040 TaxID=2692859 RepID=UPI00168324DA|nr:transglycosylase SLT domain-containing protein [Pseudanabaena sp. FACHB-2040]MBD2261023.1 transglycosylase SLT domain-containing protein [Pseudanabaena sp. FACHB-2040]